MGLFSKKDKDKKKDETSAAPQQQQQQQQQQHPNLLNPTPTAPPPSKEPVSTNPAQQNSQSSWHDSTYQSYNGSNVSEEPQIRKQQEQRLQGQAPGTTVTTTTTTTTTVTTVTSDGRTQTQVYPYNPVTDPPIRTSETTSGDDTSRTRSLGGSSNTNTISNPNSTTNIPQTQNTTQSTAPATQLAPGPHGPERPEIQRTVSPGRKPTPQELDSDSHFKVIPPTPQGSMSSKGPQSPTTTGGRIIPPRSEKRVSPRGSFGNHAAVEPGPDFLPDGPLSPGPPMRSEKRNSIDRGLNVAPLKTSNSPSRSGSRPVSSGYGQPLEQTYSGRSSYEAPPHPPPKDSDVWHHRKQQESEYAPNQVHPAERNSTNTPTSTYTPVGGSSYDPLSPTSPTNYGPNSRSHTPNSYQRPGPTVTSPVQSHYDPPPTSAQAMHPPTHDAPDIPGNTTTISSNGQPPSKSHTYRQSFSQTMKGIQGASDVIRGTVNSNIAKVTREKEEAERQRAIREKGLAEYRSSGLQEQMRGWGGRVPVGQKADGTTRLRKRSLSRNGVHGSEGPSGLEPVEERSISSQ